MAREIDAKVASIVSERSIAINVGGENGVEENCSVIVWRSVEVEDPDTGEILGTMALKNLTLEVFEVHERFSLARIRTPRYNPFGGVLLGGMLKPSKVISSSDRVLDKEYVNLSVGDSVTVVLDDDEDDI